MKNFYFTILLLILSVTVTVRINAQTNGANIILNPTFDTDDAGWGHYFDYFWDPTNPNAANASLSVEPKAGFTGNAYKVSIINAGTATYSVQISYPMALEAGKKYAMKFKASADANRTMEVRLQQDIAPKTGWYVSPTINLTTTPTVFGPYNFTATTTDPSNLFKLYLGSGGTANGISAYFDDINVVEIVEVAGATISDPPTNVTAVEGSAKATVSFTAPVNTGLLNLRPYKVIANPGGITAIGTSSPIIVDGLTNDQTYTFTVIANNAMGASVPSAASNAVTPTALIYGGNIILNPTFNTDDAGWGHYFDYFWNPSSPNHVQASLSVIPKAGYSGNAYKVSIINAGTQPYSVQISYSVPIEIGKKYSMKFKASADAARIVQINFQQNISPKTNWFLSTPINLTTTPTVYGPYFYTAIATDPTNYFKFYLGGGGTANGISAYFDDVEVTEIVDVVGATVPNAPIIGIATGGSSKATVTFTAPVNTGGLNLKLYRVTSNPGGITATGYTSPVMVDGLTDGQAYTFRVVATNAMGASVPSAASNSVTPAFIPEKYYVSDATGDNNNDGSLNHPFKTIQHAADLTTRGATVYIMTGTYINNPGYEIVFLTKSGTSAFPITFRAYDMNNKPTLKMNLTGTGLNTIVGWQAIKVNGVSYTNIVGLNIVGPNDALNLAKGEEIYEYYKAEKAKNNGLVDVNYNYVTTTNTSGIVITKNGAIYPHHITVDSCIVSKFPGGGIASQYGDYITIQNNTVFDNAWYTQWASSGISVSQGVHFDNYTEYKTIVKNNVVYGNKTLVKWEAADVYSDGNGIIADLNHNVPNEGLSVIEDYNGRTLFMNNISYNNGGSGLHTVSANNVDIVNNTAYKNGTRPENRGGAYANIFFCCSSENNKIMNNIIYAETGRASIGDVSIYGTNTGSFYSNNIYYNGLVPTLGACDMIINPGFKEPFTNVNENITDNFKITRSSPAYNKGVEGEWSFYKDIVGTVRPQDGKIDLGALEAIYSDTITTAVGTPTTLVASACSGTLKWYNGSGTQINMPLNPSCSGYFTSQCEQASTPCSPVSSKIFLKVTHAFEITSIINGGNWEDTTTWNSGRIPQIDDLVIINSNHNVFITSDTAKAKCLEMRANANLKYSTVTSKLSVGF